VLALGSARLCADALAAGLMVAAPIAAVLVFAEIAVGAVARGAPALAGFVAYAPARSVLVLAVALLGAAVLLGALPLAFERAIDDARRLLGTP
jgi:flagellar biosynthesis protein FliR